MHNTRCASTIPSRKEKEKLRRQWIPLPTSIYNLGKGATLVPGTVKILHQKEKLKISGDQELQA